MKESGLLNLTFNCGFMFFSSMPVKFQTSDRLLWPVTEAWVSSLRCIRQEWVSTALLIARGWFSVIYEASQVSFLSTHTCFDAREASVPRSMMHSSLRFIDLCVFVCLCSHMNVLFDLLIEDPLLHCSCSTSGNTHRNPGLPSLGTEMGFAVIYSFDFFNVAGRDAQYISI